MYYVTAAQTFYFIPESNYFLTMSNTENIKITSITIKMWNKITVTRIKHPQKQEKLSKSKRYIAANLLLVKQYALLLWVRPLINT